MKVEAIFSLPPLISKAVAVRNGLQQKPITFVAASTKLKDILLPMPSLQIEQANTSRVLAHCPAPYDHFKHHLLVCYGGTTKSA